MKKLSVIIPAYNEEKRLPTTLLDIDVTLRNQPFDYEILVVNDGSVDGTVRVVEELKKQVNKLSIIDNKENHGKGWVIKQGMLSATGDIRLFMDSDNSTQVKEVFNMLPYFEQGYDIVIGSRYISTSKIVVKQPFYRIFFGKIFRFISHTLVPVGAVDLVCGFKVFSEKAVNIVFPKQTIFRWAFDIEVLMIAKKNNLKIKEVPVTWRDNAASDVKFYDMVRTFFEIIQIRLKF